jgi:hypothetical protein
MIWSIVTNILLRGLGPLNGWKTWAGIALAVIDAIAQYFDVVPAALPTGLTEVIPTILIGLGLGDKMGKERANPTPK